MSRLQEYLRAVGAPGEEQRGCRDRYEAKLSNVFEGSVTGNKGKKNYAFLSGHYYGMLDELIDMIGRSRVVALCDAHANIDDAARR